MLVAGKTLAKVTEDEVPVSIRSRFSRDVIAR
jgi:hypothetical protein